MKKIILSLVFLVVFGLLTIGLVSPAKAQVKEVPNFCTTTNDVKVRDGVVKKGSYIGEIKCNLKTDSTACCLDDTGDCTETGTKGRADWGLICLMDKVYNAINWIFWILMAVTGILVLIGAFYYAFAGGDATKSAKGKQIIVAAIVSLIVAMFSRAIPSIIMAILG